MNAHRRHVMLVCEQLDMDLLPPKKGSPGILALKDGRIVIDATTWKRAAQQLAKWREEHVYA